MLWTKQAKEKIVKICTEILDKRLNKLYIRKNDETNSFYKLLTGDPPDLRFARCAAAAGVAIVLNNSF